MHLGDCALCIVDVFVEDVCDTSVDVEGWVHGHPQILDGAIFAKYLTDMVFFNIASQCLDNNL